MTSESPIRAGARQRLDKEDREIISAARRAGSTPGMGAAR